MGCRKRISIRAKLIFSNEVNIEVRKFPDWMKMTMGV
ncbi:unnamed protein product, partial [marine sediment metagenome]